jgi:serine/threonine protein kinase
LDGSGTIKLADFGFATRIKKNSPRLFSFCGTMAFLAPELAKKWESMGNVEYDEMVDVWAIGVVLFESLHGSLPFGGVDHIINVKQQGPPIRKDLNRFAKNLILQFLMYDPKKRIRLDQVKNHDWIQETLHNSKENIAPSRRSDECGNIYLGNAFL